MLDLTNRPWRPSFRVMEETARRARENASELTAVIDAAMSLDDRFHMPWRTLAEHYRARGWSGDGAEHQAALRRDGWVRIEQGGAWFWLLARGAKPWVSPRFLLERCKKCIHAGNYRCACLPTNDVTRTTKLYVLKLRDDALYVGISTTPMERFEKHCSSGGAQWTGKHRPLRIASIREVNAATALAEEAQATLKLMRRYGVERVQGGPYLGERGRTIAERVL